MHHSGIILIDKEGGRSSAAVVSEVKRVMRLDKVGHAGTLDPLATGLLVCVFGKATRLAAVAEQGEKEYSGVIRLGVTSSTDDCEGEVLSESAVPPIDDTTLREIASRFHGTIMQVPPQVSALKVGGERAYTLARRGEVVPLAAREVTVTEIDLRCADSTRIAYRIRCSKGTYIRSIARDIGELLRCGAVIETLRREYSHPFSVREAVRVNELSEGAIVPWERLVPSAPRIVARPHELRDLARGNQSGLADLFLRARMAEPIGSPTVLYCDEHGEPHGVLTREGEGYRSFLFVGTTREG